MVFGATKWREAETLCRKLQSNSQRNLQPKAMGEKSAHLWMDSKVSKIGNYIKEFAIHMNYELCNYEFMFIGQGIFGSFNKWSGQSYFVTKQLCH